MFSNADLEDTLQSSFDVLDQTLLQIEETASELQYQSAVPQQQLNEIIVSMHASNTEPNSWKAEEKRQTMRILNSLNRP